VLEAAGGSVRGYEDADFHYGKADKRFLNEWFVARGG
jgi:3'-phosphoadenosine 5'-phosphosulfate (PAPS) 3'-phosphatase